jgi:DNA invertase Pin-like site-specific DNA recombinase
MIYGYARVSTEGQNLDGQLEQLRDAGAAKVFQEKISGAGADRPQLKKALAALDAGDVLTVTRIDRLARSTRDLLNIIHEVKQTGASFRSIAEPWADTSSELAEFMLTILGAAAKLERATILVRTGEGRARAKAAGKSLGRKPKLTTQQQREALSMLGQERGVREVAEIFDVHHSTISRLKSGEAARARMMASG